MRPREPRAAAPRSIQRLDEENAVLPRSVVVLDDPVDLEAECPVEVDRALVRRRRDTAHRRASRIPGGVEEALVELAPETSAALLGRNADEVDVRIGRVGLGEEADQKPGKTPLGVLGDEARPLEVEKKELRQHGSHLAAAPPCVDVLDDPPVVGRLCVANEDAHGAQANRGGEITRAWATLKGSALRSHAAVAGIRFLIPVVAAAAVAAGFMAPAAGASQLIARDARAVKLQVDARGKAMLTYRVHGRTRHVLAWGAVNAIHASEDRKQVAFKVDYSGGWRSFGRTLWKGFRNVCRPARVELAWLVTACRTPDGSYWALQSWQRGLRNYGEPSTGTRDDWELRLSHWTGHVPQLDVGLGWAYRRFHSLYGRYTWRGRGIHGFASTPAGVPLDSFGRNLYVDTLNSAYGSGWRRENGFLSHIGTGGFCYGFYPHGSRPSGMGQRYRISVSGPGVLPDASWTGAPPSAYDRAFDLAADLAQAKLLAQDRLCRPR